ncbi:MAG: adenylyltransferase/cytidyltransferase family protein [Chthoniobacterales bacterium]
MTDRILSPDALPAWAAEFQASGRRLVLTNGCFDILHAGHVDYLERAAALGDALAIAVNSDASVRTLKGPSRPVNSEGDRARVISALRSVEVVSIFDSPRLTETILAVRPAIYAKGGDYTIDTLDPGERGALESVGSQIKILPLVPGRSTTAILARAQVAPSQE